MAITFVSESHSPGYGSTYATSVTINKPTGTANNDLMIMFVAGNASAPSGWTQLMSVATVDSSMGNAQVYYNVAGSSEPSSYTVNFTGGPFWSQMACIATYRGCDTSTPIDTGNAAMQAVHGGTNFNTSSVTSDGTQWAVSFAGDYTFSGSTHTYSAGSGTERADFTNTTGDPAGAAFAFYDSNGAVSSGSFSRTQTASATVSDGAKGILLLNPANVNVNKSASDTASGAETAALVASKIPGADTAHGTDAANAGVPVNGTDAATAADSGKVVAQAAAADSGAGSESILVINKPQAVETATAIDAGAGAINIDGGTEGVVYTENAVVFFPLPTPPAVDTAVGVDGVTQSIAQVAEMATATDVGRSYNLLILNDNANGADLGALHIVDPGRPQLRCARVKVESRTYTVVPVPGGG